MVDVRVKDECPSCGSTEYEEELHDCPFCGNLKCSMCDKGDDVSCTACENEEDWNE